MTLRRFSTTKVSRSRSFSTSGTTTSNNVSRQMRIDYLIVAGGGGGGGSSGTDSDRDGGGGAGGLVMGSVAASKFGIGTAISIQVGTAGSTSTSPTAGGNSYLGPVIAYGGGTGGYFGANAGAGGSGGGSGRSSNPAGKTQINYPEHGGTGFGNAGGGQGNGIFASSAGGGGGALGPGGFSGGDSGGLGMVSTITGSAVTYASGGRAGSLITYPANTGSGGSAQPYAGITQPTDGVVIIRHLASYPQATTTGSPTITVYGNYLIYKFTSSGSITFPG